MQSSGENIILILGVKSVKEGMQGGFFFFKGGPK